MTIHEKLSLMKNITVLKNELSAKLSNNLNDK